jgi:DNA-binding CsgD family transcriptional regulator
MQSCIQTGTENDVAKKAVKKKKVPITDLMKQKLVLQRQIKAARVRDMKDSAMSPEDYRSAVEREQGLTLAQAGVLFGVSTRTSQRWALAELPVPTSVAHLLRLMKKTGTKPYDLDRTLRPSVSEAA